MAEISIRAPATVSNVVCGFDCLGFALERPFDEVTVRKIDERGVVIRHLDDFNLPTDPRRNVAGASLLALLEAAGADFGFEVTLAKGIRPGSGIGSSAASASGAVAAANKLLGDPFSLNDLIGFAMEGEAISSGTRHADNAAPCLFGGFTLVRSAETPDIVRLEYPPLSAVVIHPHIEIRTAAARSILPKLVSLRDAVKQWSNLGAFVAGLAAGDYDLISRSMQDFIVEPARKTLIPGFDDVRAAGLAAGALGGGISGSGPSMFMLCRTDEIAAEVKSAMLRAFRKTGLDCDTYLSGIAAAGACQIHPSEFLLLHARRKLLK